MGERHYIANGPDDAAGLYHHGWMHLMVRLELRVNIVCKAAHNTDEPENGVSQIISVQHDITCLRALTRATDMDFRQHTERMTLPTSTNYMHVVNHNVVQGNAKIYIYYKPCEGSVDLNCY
eukprot:scaffold271918_cov18-Prasinocladus_malaysianus.AAC.1